MEASQSGRILDLGSGTCKIDTVCYCPGASRRSLYIVEYKHFIRKVLNLGLELICASKGF
jgi:hypothetical protein